MSKLVERFLKMIQVDSTFAVFSGLREGRVIPLDVAQLGQLLLY